MRCRCSGATRRSRAARRGRRCRCTCTACRATATNGRSSCDAAAASRSTCPASGARASPGICDYTIDEYDRFIERFLDELGVERVQLVVHDWGAVGLAFAQRLPERVERVVIINAVPFLPGYRWHRTARIWRTPGLGELVMGTTSRFTLRLASRESNATPGPMPEEWLDSVLEHFDQGTQRAILRLYRSSPPEVLAAAGARWGRSRRRRSSCGACATPTSPRASAREYAHALANAELLELPDAGPLAVARPPGRDRPRGGVPERRVSAAVPAAGHGTPSSRRRRSPIASSCCAHHRRGRSRRRSRSST